MKSLIQQSSLAALVFLAALPARAATVSVRVSQDTYIRNEPGLGSANQNDDADNEMLVGRNSLTDDILRPLLGFDVSRITNDVATVGGGDFGNLTITSATLTIYERRGQSPGGTPRIDVSSYDPGFVDSVSTWVDPDGDGDSGTGDTTAGGSLGTLLADDFAISWDSAADNDSSVITLSGAGLITAIQDSATLGDLSFIISSAGYTGSPSFHSITSDRSGDASRHALLEIEYTVAGAGQNPAIQLAVATSGSDLVFTWNSRAGKVYDLLSATGLASTPDTWSVWDGNAGIAATPDQNTLTIARPGDATRFFAIAERDAPPLFTENFDGVTAPSLPDGWVAGGTSGDPATAWELGAPTAVTSPTADPQAPTAAFSGTNCVGTNLTAIYGPDAAVTLTSPAIAIPAGGATLTFQQVVDIDGPNAPLGGGADFGTLRVLDAADDSELAVLVPQVEGTTDGAWTESTAPMPAEALGLSVKLEFGLTSDSNGGVADGFELAGWYLDDVQVTAD